MGSGSTLTAIRSRIASLRTSNSSGDSNPSTPVLEVCRCDTQLYCGCSMSRYLEQGSHIRPSSRMRLDEERSGLDAVSIDIRASQPHTVSHPQPAPSAPAVGRTSVPSDSATSRPVEPRSLANASSRPLPSTLAQNARDRLDRAGAAASPGSQQNAVSNSSITFTAANLRYILR